MNKTIVLCSVLALSGAVEIQAQQGSANPRPVNGQGPSPTVTVLGADKGVMPSVTVTPLGGAVVKGIPYSAEMLTERVQVLADGNRIIERKTGRVYRDSEGRVRREEDRSSGGPTVTIMDPVAGSSFTLDPLTHTARETPTVMVVQSLGRAMAVTSTLPGLSAQEAGNRPRSVTDGSSSGQPVGSPRAPVPVRGGPGSIALSQEKLPDRVIEGVFASGVRRATTIEKGAIGNEQPIKIVSEEWTSTDLQVLVMTDLSDPRTGRSTYRLLKITRAEPDPGLFQIPSDYTVQRRRDTAPQAPVRRGLGAAGGR